MEFDARKEAAVYKKFKKTLVASWSATTIISSSSSPWFFLRIPQSTCLCTTLVLLVLVRLVLVWVLPSGLLNLSPLKPLGLVPSTHSLAQLNEIQSISTVLVAFKSLPPICLWSVVRTFSGHWTLCPILVKTSALLATAGIKIALNTKTLWVYAIIIRFRAHNLTVSNSQHVEQLLRTLNLNSPAPFAKKPQLNLDVSQNPDFSPASVSSALLTPTDLSPARALFDPKNPGQSPYDSAHNLSLTPSSSLLFDQQTAPVKLSDSLEATPGNLRYSLSHSSSSGIPPFQPFSEAPTPAPQTHNLHTLFPNTSPSHVQSIYSSPLPRRIQETNRLPQMDWRLTQQPLSQQPLALHPDWRLPSEKAALDFNLNQIGHSESLRSTLIHQQPSPPQSSQTAHEVSIESFTIPMPGD